MGGGTVILMMFNCFPLLMPCLFIFLWHLQSGLLPDRGSWFADRLSFDAIPVDDSCWSTGLPSKRDRILCLITTPSFVVDLFFFFILIFLLFYVIVVFFFFELLAA